MDNKLEDVLASKPVFVNVGVTTFADNLIEAGYPVVQVQWSPPAGGDPEMAKLLDELL